MSDSPALPPLPGQEGSFVPVALTERKQLPVFKVSGMFSSHMVLQREKPIPVWGFADRPGTRVTGTFCGHTAEALTDENGRWKLFFPAMSASLEPSEMTVSDERGNTVTFTDILIGDVWLVGGQSNADLLLKPCLWYTPDLTFDENEPFRLFATHRQYSVDHPETLSEPQADIICPDWSWKLPDRENSLDFSALGWYFARAVTRKVKVPLGMVMCGFGGACLQELVPADLARAEGCFRGANVCVGGYYNAFLAPMEGLSFRGMLFFQGESEGCWRNLSECYARDLSLLVYDERQRFGFRFPFYNVQIASYRTEGAGFFRWLDIVRTQQVEALKSIPDSTLTVSMDWGSPEGYPDWAHSPYKQIISNRLADLVLAKEYGIGSVDEAQSPMPVEAVLSEDRKTAVLRFEHIGGGLCILGKTPEESLGQPVAGFSCGPYDARKPAEAVITAPDTVTVKIPWSADESLVNYTFFKVVTPENSNLRNGLGLPCPAFSMKTR